MSDNETIKETTDRKDEKEDKVKETASKSKIINIVLVIVVVGLTGCIAFLLLHNGKKSTEEVESKRLSVVDENNIDEVIEQFDQNGNVLPGNYEAKMNSTWQFADGKSASYNAYVENVENNTNAVYFDVMLSDTGETIYESPVLPLGSHIDEIKLNAELSAGTYDAILVYHLIDDDQNTISTVNFGITIIIES